MTTTLDDLFRIIGGSPLAWWTHALALFEAAGAISVLSRDAEQMLSKLPLPEEPLERGLSVSVSPDPATAGAQLALSARAAMAPIATLLGAMAIENELKAVNLAHDPGLIEDSERWGRLCTHDLARLAADADLALGGDELNLLRDLSTVILWAGKYPVPRRVEDFPAKGASRPGTLLEIPFESICELRSRILALAEDRLR